MEYQLGWPGLGLIVVREPRPQPPASGSCRGRRRVSSEIKKEATGNWDRQIRGLGTAELRNDDTRELGLKQAGIGSGIFLAFLFDRKKDSLDCFGSSAIFAYNKEGRRGVLLSQWHSFSS
jgi:hypothetical protein